MGGEDAEGLSLQVTRAERRAEERKCPFDTLAL